MNLLAHIAQNPVVLSNADCRLSGAELQEHCARIAESLSARQLSRVALLADNSLDWVYIDLACQQVGICLVPVPTFFSRQQLQHVLHSCGIQAVITDRPAELADFITLQGEFSPCAGTDLQLGRLDAVTDSVLLPAGTHKITFTSGSTGTPKGVCLSTNHLLTQAQRLCDAVAIEQPRHLCLLPLSTLLENVAGVYAPLLAQGEVVVPHSQQLGFSGSVLKDPQQLLRQITALAPDTLILIPQLLSLLVAATAQGWRAPASLKFVAVGGARVLLQTILEARATGIPVYEGYGLSECASVVSLNSVANDRPGSCGKPLPGLGVSLQDGEVVISGSTMLGYVNEPDSWNPSQIASGDEGYLDAEGFLRINGRRKNILISSYGRNVSPEWVESELLANPLLAEAVVIGDALPYCAALLSVWGADTADATIQDWIDRVNTQLPDYARVQRWLRLPAPLSNNPNLMTANGRPRRDRINLEFQTEIQRLYAEPHARALPEMEAVAIAGA